MFNLGDKVYFKENASAIAGEPAEKRKMMRKCVWEVKDVDYLPSTKEYIYVISTDGHVKYGVLEKDLILAYNYDIGQLVTLKCGTEKERSYIWKIENKLCDPARNKYRYDLRRVVNGETCSYTNIFVPGEDLVPYEPKNVFRKGDKIHYKRAGSIRIGYIDAIDIPKRLISVIENPYGAGYWIDVSTVIIDESITEKEKIYAKHDEETTKEFLNRIYGIGYKPEAHSDNVDALSYGLNYINKENKNMKQQQKKRNHDYVIVKEENFGRRIKEVIFNGPATIIKWEPTLEQLGYGKKGDKTVVVCQDGDKQDMKVGFLLAIIKEMVDNQSYDNILRKIDWMEKFNFEDPIFSDDRQKIANRITDMILNGAPEEDISKAIKDSMSVIDNAHVDKKAVLEEAEKKTYILAEDDKYDPYKFNVGDIVRLKNGSVWFKVTKLTWFRNGDRRINRYRLERFRPDGSHKSRYECYENENRLELVKKGDK